MMQLIGEIRGVRTRKVREYTFHSLVVEDEDMESHSIDLGSDLTEEFQNGLNKLAGQVCSVPFYVRVYQSKTGKTGVSLNYQGDTLPRPFQGAANLQAASSK